MYWGDMCLFVVAYLIWHWSYQTYRNYRSKNIFKKVKWIAERSPYKSVGYWANGNLLHYIKECKSYSVKGIHINEVAYTIPKEYQIDYSNKQDVSFVSEILEKFRKHVIETFFDETKDSLSKKQKQLYKMRMETYFMYSLLCYLRACIKNDSQILGKEIYQHNDKEVNSTCNHYLTDFGRVCYKLYLISALSCENSDNAKSLVEQSETDYIMVHLNK